MAKRDWWLLKIEARYWETNWVDRLAAHLGWLIVVLSFGALAWKLLAEIVF